MRVLLRADVPFVSHWGMELLVTQLYDQSKVVALEALNVIDEACEEEVGLFPTGVTGFLIRSYHISLYIH
jgi:rapamycin-insensitive companion of mTOR